VQGEETHGAPNHSPEQPAESSESAESPQEILHEIEAEVPVAPETEADQHAETAHGEEGHAAEEHGEGVPEIPNAIQLIYEYTHEKALEEGTDPSAGAAGLFKTLHKGPIKEPLPIVGTLPWENHVFAVGSALFLILLFWLGVRNLSVRSPSRWQALVEKTIEGFDRFICDILGPKHGRIFAPYVMTLFLFLLVNNLMILVPFLKSSTSSLVLTGSLAALTFVIVQVTALTNLGPLGYLYHLMGEPVGVVMWILSPLFFVLHVIGELARPVSLALRLFGNILGEDILLGAFLMMGVALAGTLGIHPPAPGFPFHFPFMFLVILTSTIQALVFSLLTTIYILLVLPHDTHHDHEEAHEPAADQAALEPSVPDSTPEVPAT